MQYNADWQILWKLYENAKKLLITLSYSTVTSPLDLQERWWPTVDMRCLNPWYGSL